MVEKKQERFWSLIVFMVIYFSHDTMMFGQNSSAIFMNIGKVIPFCLLMMILMLNRSELRIEKSLFVVSVLLSALPFITCFRHGEAVSNYVYRASLIFVAAFIIQRLGFDCFQTEYLKVMRFLSVYSLCVWILAMVVPNFVRLFPVSINSNGIKFYNFVFSLADFDARSSIVRNGSIFREPGVFVVYLVIALVFSLNQPKMHFKDLLIYMITLITTFSTAGYILLVLVGAYIFFSKVEYKYKKYFFIIFVLAAFYLLFFTGMLGSDSFIFAKFNAANNSYGSWFARLSSLFGNIKISLENPLFGIGRINLYNTVLATAGANNRFIAVDNTNTVLICFAAYGILFGCIILLGFVRHCYKYHHKFIPTIMLFIILFAALSNEDFGQNILFYVLVVEGYSSSRNKVGDNLYGKSAIF